MPYSGFHTAFPVVAESETRTVTLRQHMFGVPPGSYTFLEMYCDEPECDCRRVFLYVVPSHNDDAAAVIAYGWEPPEYYVKWMGDDDPSVIRSLQGPELNLASPQSALAPALLELFLKTLIPDTAYIERIKRHYAMFRNRIDQRKTTKKRKGQRKA